MKLDVPSESLNSILSGALDRLHSQDQCVRYDSERKLWIYQHSHLKIDNPDWQFDALSNNIMATNSLIPDKQHPMIEKWLASKHKEEGLLGKRSHSKAF